MSNQGLAPQELGEVWWWWGGHVLDDPMGVPLLCPGGVLYTMSAFSSTQDLVGSVLSVRVSLEKVSFQTKFLNHDLMDVSLHPPLASI